MLFAKSKSNLSITSILGLSVITLTSLLTACGGGGGGSSSVSTVTPPATVAISVTPAMGAFQDGSTVKIFNSSGTLCATGTTKGGVATLTITPSTCTAPLIVQAGVAGDLYFNEATNAFVAITGNNGIRAVVPSTSYTSIGVTPLTEIAAAALISSSGGLNSGVTPASVTAQNATIAKILSNGSVTDPLAVPAAASSSSSKATNTYGAILAMLSYIAPGQSAQTITNNLALDLSKGSWNGTNASGAAIQGAILPSDFGTLMAAAAIAASGVINSTAAPTISFSSYVPAVNITTAVANNSGSTVPAGDPIAAAKSMFTSLRTNANLLATPTTSGSFAYDLQTNSNNLVNVVLPGVNQLADRLQTIMQANHFLNDIATNGITNYPSLSSCATGPVVGNCSQAFTSLTTLTTANGFTSTYPAGTTFIRYEYNNGNNLMICYTVQPTTSISTLTAGNITATSPSSSSNLTGSLTVSYPGTVVVCKGNIDPVFYASGTPVYPFYRTAISYVSAGNYNYVSRTQWYLKPGDGGATNLTNAQTDPTTGLKSSIFYSGNASITTARTGPVDSITVTGDFAGYGATGAGIYDHTNVNGLTYTRTWTAPATTDANYPYALANYAMSGTFSSFPAATGAATGIFTLGSGSFISHLEDSTGSAPPSTTTASVPLTTPTPTAGASATLILQGTEQNGSATSTINGTLSASNFACDISLITCGPQNVSFTGSMANTLMGTFATLSITDTIDYSAYDGTLPNNGGNMALMTGSISGTVTNNLVTPAMTYSLTLNANNSADTASPIPNILLTMGLIYSDPSTTVNVNTVVNTGPTGSGPATPVPTTINLSSGTVVGTLTATPGAGVTGTLYNGTTSGTQIGTVGTLNGVIGITYSDGTFYSLQ